MEYTTAPWQQTIVKNKRTGVQGTNISSAESAGVIAHVYNTDEPEAAFYARLIVQAPLMYQALRNIIFRVDEGLALGEKLDIEPAREIIAKVEL